MNALCEYEVNHQLRCILGLVVHPWSGSYNAVTNLGKAYRTPAAKQDFYTFFDVWARGEKLNNVEDEHYVMATLVRGGVFGESDK